MQEDEKIYLVHLLGSFDSCYWATTIVFPHNEPT